jgi:hypothetical protein
MFTQEYSFNIAFLSKGSKCRGNFRKFWEIWRILPVGKQIPKEYNYTEAKHVIQKR